MYDTINLHKKIHDTFQKNKIRCNFHIEQFTKIKSPRFIIVCCLFKLKNQYRNIVFYIKQLQLSIKKIPDDIILRIYYDKSIEKEIKENFIHPNLELIRYEFPQFLTKDNTHKSLFGTIIRTIPIFDWGDEANDSIIYCIHDADTFIDYKEINNIIKYMQKNKYNIYDLFNDCVYQELENRSKCNRVIEGELLLANCIIIDKIDCSILTNFLKDTLNLTIELKKWIDFNKKIRNNKNQIAPFFYGIDEYFMNCYIFPEWKKKKYNILGTIFCMKLRNIQYEFYKQYIQYKKLTNTQVNILKQIIKDIWVGDKKVLKMVEESVYNFMTDIDKKLNTGSLMLAGLNIMLDFHIKCYRMFYELLKYKEFKISEEYKKCIEKNSTFINDRYIEFRFSDI